MKTQGKWVVKTDWRKPRKEVVGDICLRSARVTQDYRADDDDNDKDSITLSISCRMG